MSDLINYFNSHYRAKQEATLDFSEALVSVLNHYMQENADFLEYESILTIEKFIKHIESAQLGAIILGYGFPSDLPQDLIEFLNYAIKIEYTLAKSPSPLLIDCENKAATKAHSPAVMFEQAGRLERALMNDVVEVRHIPQVKNKLAEYLELLYQKFADLILDAKSLEELNASIMTAFNKEDCENLEQLGMFEKDMQNQVSFLKSDGFFNDFYSEPSLAGKYDFVYQYYQNCKEAGEPFGTTPKLKTTLSHLFFQTLNKAYSPIEVKKFNLMRNAGATLEDVFGTLNEWTTRKWRAYNTSELFEALMTRLAQDEEYFKDWQEISDIENKRSVSEPLPAFQLYGMKFAGNPNKNPKDILKEIQVNNLPPSPKKVTHSNSRSRDQVVTAKRSLFNHS